MNVSILILYVLDPGQMGSPHTLIYFYFLDTLDAVSTFGQERKCHVYEESPTYGTVPHVRTLPHYLKSSLL